MKRLFCLLVSAALGPACTGDGSSSSSSGGGSSSSSGGMASSSSGSSGAASGSSGGGVDCAGMCAHIYADCSLVFSSPSGQLDQQGCVAQCQGGSFSGHEACLQTAECTTAALNACLSGSGSSSSSSSGGASSSSSSGGNTGWADEETEVLALVNQHRAAGANCGGTAFSPANALQADDALHAAARDHAVDMATNDYFSHTSQDGRTFSQRIQQAGYTGGGQLAENIAAGNSSAAATVQQWMNSPGHCSNIMNPSLRKLGVGHAYNASSMWGHYWVQTFGG